MLSDLITPEEIKMLRAGAKTITPEMMMEAVLNRKLIPVIPIKLHSGYLISMTIDKSISKIFEQVSVSRSGGYTDPADAEIIAKAVIGECEMMGSVLNKNVIHFIKIVEEK